MKHSRTLTRRLAFVLIRRTAWLLPKGRTEWAEAMLSELHHLDSDYEALVWAIGCLISALKERIYAMNAGDLRISPWVLVPEMLLCFGPLTMGWLDVAFGGSGVVRLNVEVIQLYFIGAPGGIAALAMMLSGALLGVLGPVGLLAAFRLIALGRPIHSLLRTVLIAGPILLGVIYVVGNVIMGSGAKAFEAGFLLLFFILPVVGAAHMHYLGPYSPRRKVPA